MMKPDDEFLWIVTAPGGAGNTDLAIAAAGAGAVGCIDLEYVTGPAAARAAIHAAAAGDARRLGAKLRSDVPGTWRSLVTGLESRLAYVILCRPHPRLLKGQIGAIQERGLKVLVEVTSAAEALAAESAGADAVVGKGNEAAGRVGEMCSFVMLQQFLKALSIPVIVQGGVGIHTAAACRAVGARGVVLDWQAALAIESALPAGLKRLAGAMSGTEPVCVGRQVGELYRLHFPPGSELPGELEELDRHLGEHAPRRQALKQWRTRIDELCAAPWPDGALPMGQDVSFARRLAERHGTVAGILGAMRRNAKRNPLRARTLRPLAENRGNRPAAPTRYPVIQGPMSRVTDVSPFAKAVADGGGLPLVAASTLTETELDDLLGRCREELGDAAWGVGLLGFIDADLYNVHARLVRKHAAPSVLIAGGSPEQARDFEESGIPAYLHVPSHRLLRLYLDDGARRFVFEGRECGGHVGRYSSFVLWENAVETLTGAVGNRTPGEQFHIWFAGGIGGDVAAAMVSVLAVPLVERGMRVGVMVGTAYLATRESVTTGAIREDFQKKLLAEQQTRMLDCGGGYEIRTAPCEFVKTFYDTKRELGSTDPEAARMTLEMLTLGRLRIAAKGREFDPAGPTGTETLPVTPAGVRKKGLFMAGQVIALHDKVITIAGLHKSLSQGGQRVLARLPSPRPRRGRAGSAPSCDVAIVGMSCFLPGAAGPRDFWDNILNKKDAFSEVPAENWDWHRYFDADKKARDKVYSRWGCFMDPVEFDPMEYGIPPKSMKAVDPMQLLALRSADLALRDAGYRPCELDRETTCVFVGEGGGLGEVGALYCARSHLPMLMERVPESILSQLPEWTEDTFPGLLPNVIAGRISNALDLGGANMSTSAACASGLAALYLGLRELGTGMSREAIVVGIDIVMSPFAYTCFSKTMALSPTGACRPFDADADGIVLGQGVGAVLLKRLEDAERDGDRVYAVIRGIGTASDGRAGSLTSPCPQGQVRAMTRAYAQAGFGPEAVGLVEAHATGTVLGDSTEARSLATLFADAGGRPRHCAVGSVKSMIGHTKGAAGMAGLIKTALALYHKALPPTIGVDRPVPEDCWSDNSPLYLNTSRRPWIDAPGNRKAGVNSFGFGGTNFHVVLEERDAGGATPEPFALEAWPAELFTFAAGSDEDLLSLIARFEQLAAAPGTELRDLAFTAYEMSRGATTPGGAAGTRLAVVADSVADLQSKLNDARALLGDKRAQGVVSDPRGFCVSRGREARDGKVAFVFPGQGSQRTDMLKDLCLLFPQVRDAVQNADAALAGRLPRKLSDYIYPPPGFTRDRAAQAMAELTRTNITQPALAAAAMGVKDLLGTFGITPAMAAGHSAGEYMALCCAGVLSEDTLYRLMEVRGRCILDVVTDRKQGMLAAKCGPSDVKRALGDSPGVYAANLNAPQQTVLAGLVENLETAAERLAEAGIRARMIPVNCAFHSPFVAGARDAFAGELARVDFSAPCMPVYSNARGARYPARVASIRKGLQEHLVQPVRFVEEIRAMYADGARVFVEVGPGHVMTNLVRRILADHEQEILAVPCDVPGQDNGIRSFLLALALLWAEGLPVRLHPLFSRRRVRNVADAGAGDASANTWMVAASAAWPAAEDRPTITPAPIGPDRGVPQGATESLFADRDSFMAGPGNTQRVGSDVESEVMLRHQWLMATIARLHSEVMLAYLEGGEGRSVRAPTGPGQAARLPAPAAAPPGPDTADATPAPGDSVLDVLVALVSDQTGYPPEMLEVDLDMEADLGIDSIKRTEILSTARKTFPHLPADAGEKFSKVRTLRGVVEVIESHRGAETGGAPAAPAGGTPATTGDGKPRRELAVLEQTPCGAGKTGPMPPGVLLITDDGSGCAPRLQELVGKAGGKAALVQHKGRQNLRKSVFSCDLASAEETTGLVRRVRERLGRIGGVVHLLPLREAEDFSDLTLDAWRGLVDVEVRGMFCLLRAAADDLAGTAGAWVAACVSAGGEIRDERMPRPSRPWRGGIAGLVKTAAAEWPAAVCAAIDTDAASPGALADQVMSELSSAEAVREVFYRGSERYAPQLRRVPHGTPRDGPELTADDVIVMLGGARGITAGVGRELARRYRSTIVAIGRSEWPGDAPPEYAAGKDGKDLRSAIISDLRKRGRKPDAANVETAFEGIMKARAMTATRADVEAAGGKFFYYPADARDEQSMRDVFEKIYSEHGRIDGILNGAGTIEDKLLAHKTPESFDRVVDTKSASAFILSRVTRPTDLKFMVLFSSAAGWFGNRGQSDYAAANAILNQVALRLSDEWRVRVVAVNWGPWEGAGMVTDALKQMYRRAGVGLIEPAAGCGFLVDEILCGEKADCVVIAQAESAAE